MPWYRARGFSGFQVPLDEAHQAETPKGPSGMFLTNTLSLRSENTSAIIMEGQERIEINSAGLGEASNTTLEERASQIAASDGRSEVNDLDREEARRQLNEPLSDREDIEDSIAEADRPDAGVAPASFGTQKEKIPPDDETLVSEKLVREGIEEAEFDTRVRSAENEESSSQSE